MEQLKSGPKEPLMMGGPQFGESDGRWSRFSRNRSNIILSIIGILIIAGGIYLYSNYQKPGEPISPEEISLNQGDQEGVVKPEQININGQDSASNSQTQPTAEKADVVSASGGKIVVKAEKGAGVTHLARKAAKEYLTAHPEIQGVTLEHKIYIEDYLKDKTSSVGLNIGQELSFDEGLIKEAIDQSLKLNENQLQNLHKYVLLVPSLS